MPNSHLRCRAMPKTRPEQSERFGRAQPAEASSTRHCLNAGLINRDFHEQGNDREPFTYQFTCGKLGTGAPFFHFEAGPWRGDPATDDQNRYKRRNAVPFRNPERSISFPVQHRLNSIASNKRCFDCRTPGHCCFHSAIGAFARCMPGIRTRRTLPKLNSADMGANFRPQSSTGANFGDPRARSAGIHRFA